MPDNIGATPPQGDQTVGAAVDAQSAPPATDHTASAADSEYAKLMSRIAGLDAKVTSLQGETTAQTRAREAAEQKLRDYEAGKVGADEALRAQLEAKDRELEQTRREVAVAKIASAYPETFGVFGEAVANMSPDQLAAAEARFSGAPGANYRSPGANPTRPTGASGKSPDEMSLDELRAALASAPADAWTQNWSSTPTRR